LLRHLVEFLLRGLYSIVLYLLLPITFYHLLWRGLRAPAYMQRWDERYAIYPKAAPKQPCIWLHAVSVGEVNASAPLINALRKQRPDLHWLITTITPTGSQRVRSLWRDTVEHVYLPYDVPDSVQRFLRHFRPQLALILETELWPNLLLACRDQNIPVYLLNGRLSQRSFRGYYPFKPLLAPVLRTLAAVATQSTLDARRFIALGAPSANVHALGNLKFDLQPPDPTAILNEFHTHIAPLRPVWIAASTHEGEEQAVMQMHRHICAQWPQTLLLWAPRHPERFNSVAAYAKEQGWRTTTRTADHWPRSDSQIFILDTLGELIPFYACAHVAFVGGSLQAIGGHNLLEPAAMGTAIVTGPHLDNFAEIARYLRQAHALCVLNTADEVAQTIIGLLGDRLAREQMSAAGQALVAQGRGALNKIMALITPHLPAPPATGS